MKIIITLEIDVDPKIWDAEYGSGSKPAEVRADIREYVLNAVQQSHGMDSTGATVTIR